MSFAWGWICPNGHVLTTGYANPPTDHGGEHCGECGEPVIGHCQNCGRAVDGFYPRTNLPKRCHGCGQLFPWAVQLAGLASEDLNDAQLLTEIEAQKHLMITVATGGPRINEVNDEYIRRRQAIRAALQERGIEDPNPYPDLWRWYGKWSVDLPNYLSRRAFMAEMYDSLIERLMRGDAAVGTGLFDEPTGWVKVDRQIDGVRSQLEIATVEEEFQAVGFLCREALISLAQEVYDPSQHPTGNGVEPSPTDAKRMFDNYFVREHPGEKNEVLRKAARAAFSLAVELQHRRTATFRDAALCAEATIAVVNIVAILTGRREKSEGRPREETALEAAHRLEQGAERRRQHEMWLQSAEAVRVAGEEFSKVVRYWTTKVAVMKTSNPFECGKGRMEDEFAVRSPGASLVAGWSSGVVNATKARTLAISEFDGFVPGPGLFDPEHAPNRVALSRYTFDVNEDGTRGWRDTAGERHFYTSDQLAEYHLKRLVERNYRRG